MYIGINDVFHFSFFFTRIRCENDKHVCESLSEFEYEYPGKSLSTRSITLAVKRGQNCRANLL